MTKTSIFFIGLLLCLPTLFPLVRSGYFYTHDYTHVARMSELKIAVQDGHFPVRWSKNLGYGYGLPQFNFYAPLPYYLGAILMGIGFSGIAALKALWIFNVLMGYISMFFLGEKLWGKWGGFLAGIAFTYTPYRALNIYVRGALGELTAMTLVVVFLMCLVYWREKLDAKWVALSALALASILLSHNLLSLMTIPALAILVMILALVGNQDRKPRIFQGFLMLLLGFGVSCFYVLPAFFEKDMTMVNVLTQDLSDFRLHFVYLRQFLDISWGYGGSIYGLEDGISFYLGGLHLLLGAVSTIALVKYWIKLSAVGRVMGVFSIVVILAAGFMTTFHSQFLWELISLLWYIQFPWRFISLIGIFLAILVGASVLWFRNSKKTSWVAIFSIGTALLFVGFQLQYFKPEVYLEDPSEYYYSDTDRIKTEISAVIPDFIPLHNPGIKFVPAESRFELENPANTMQVMDDRVHRFSLGVNVNEDDILNLNIFDFPGWQLYLNGEKLNHETDPDTSLMQLPLKAQNNEVVVSGVFENTPIRFWSNLISLLALVTIFYLLLPKQRLMKVKK